jgi:hypothetical protein
MTCAEQQGSLDGLCGVYAVVNAVKRLVPRHLNRELLDELFRELMTTLITRRGPKVVADGAAAADIRQMLLRANRFLARRLPAAAFEFSRLSGRGRRRPRTIDALWQILNAQIEESGQRTVAILAWGSPYAEHWTCVHHVTSRSLRITDSRGNSVLSRSRLKLGEHPDRRSAVHPTDVFFVRRLP